MEYKRYYLFLIYTTVPAWRGIVIAVGNSLNATISAQRTSTKLWIECYPSNKSLFDTVYFITISKLGSLEFEEIVKIRDENKIEWKNTDFQHRVSVNGSMVTPVKDAILTISIDNANIQCTDSGVYSCIIYGLGFDYHTFQQIATTQVEACPDLCSTDNQATSVVSQASSSARKAEFNHSYEKIFLFFATLFLLNG